MKSLPLLIVALLLAPAARAAEPAKDAPKPAEAKREEAKPAEKKPDEKKPEEKKVEKKKETSYGKITRKEIDAITYEDVEEDTGFITPLAADLDNLNDDARKRLDDWTAKLNDWAGAKEENLPQRVRNLLHVAALADMVHSEYEGETAYVIFDKLKSEVDKDVLIKACAWIWLKPDEGRAVTRVPELGWDDDNEESALRERVSLYAKKLLGRLVGKLPKKD